MPTLLDLHRCVAAALHYTALAVAERPSSERIRELHTLYDLFSDLGGHEGALAGECQPFRRNFVANVLDVRIPGWEARDEWYYAELAALLFGEKLLDLSAESQQARQQFLFNYQIRYEQPFVSQELEAVTG